MISKKVKQKSQRKALYFIALFFLSPLIIGAFFLKFNSLDPLLRTQTTMVVEVLNLQITQPKKFGGKSGVPPLLDNDGMVAIRYKKITVKGENGKVFSFKKSVDFHCQVGRSVILRLYRRKITRLSRYFLENCKSQKG